MGRKGTGVEVRATSIRLTFRLDDRICRETIRVNGEPIRPTPANISYANKIAAEIKEKIRHGVFSMTEYFPASASGGVTTVEEQLDVWLRSRRVELSTMLSYQSGARFWVKAFGDKPLRKLRTSHIMMVLAARTDLSGQTVNNYVSVLREALKLAVIDRLIETNPADQVKSAKHQKEPPDPFTIDEADRIIGYLAEKHPGQIHNMVEFWFWTGLRTSELLGLRWQNVDLAAGEFQVSEAVVCGVHKERTKTSKARIVKLNSRAAAALHRQREHTQMAGEHVFIDPTCGEPWMNERTFRFRFWKPVLKLLGIRYRRPYTARHTYATAMLMAGMTPAFCARQLGHSVEMFLTTYTRWLDGAQDDIEMARLEARSGLAVGTKRDSSQILP